MCVCVCVRVCVFVLECVFVCGVHACMRVFVKAAIFASCVSLSAWCLSITSVPSFHVTLNGLLLVPLRLSYQLQSGVSRCLTMREYQLLSNSYLSS